MAQGKLEALAWRSRPKTGNATLTTDPSMKARLEPRMLAASVARGCGEEIRVCSVDVTQPRPLGDFERVSVLREIPFVEGHHAALML